MERIAFIFGEAFISWSAIVRTLACAGAVCLFLAVYLGVSGNLRGAFTVTPLAVLLSLAAARLLHWYCFAESYESLAAAMTGVREGGFALLGAFAGCLGAAALTRLLRLHRNLPQMLDCMCLAGSAGIALGRLAAFYNAEDRGRVVTAVTAMPWVYPLTNSVSGVTEYRLAVFLYQAMAAGALFAALALGYGLGKKRRKDGDVALLFLVCYGASEILLDSMRYDSMYFRFNGFVSIAQILGLVFVVLGIAVFSVRLVKARGFRGRQLLLWAAMAALMGLAGYMEYYVQRHGSEALFAYSVMGSCLALLLLLTFLTRGLARSGKENRRGGRYLQ